MNNNRGKTERKEMYGTRVSHTILARRMWRTSINDHYSKYYKNNNFCSLVI